MYKYVFSEFLLLSLSTFAFHSHIHSPVWQWPFGHESAIYAYIFPKVNKSNLTSFNLIQSFSSSSSPSTTLPSPAPSTQLLASPMKGTNLNQPSFHKSNIFNVVCVRTTKKRVFQITLQSHLYLASVLSFLAAELILGVGHPFLERYLYLALNCG